MLFQQFLNIDQGRSFDYQPNSVFKKKQKKRGRNKNFNYMQPVTIFSKEGKLTRLNCHGNVCLVCSILPLSLQILHANFPYEHFCNFPWRFIAVSKPNTFQNVSAFSQHLISRATLPALLDRIKQKSLQGIHLDFLLLDTVITS